MKAWTLVERGAADALVILVAVIGLLEFRVDSAPGQSVAGVAVALAPLLLLLRRRFSFAAPALVFAVLAGTSLVDSDAAAAEELLTLGAVFSLALAFWFAGAQDEGEPAVAGAAVGLASVAVFAASAGRDFVVLDERGDFGILTIFAIGSGLSLAAFALRRRAARTAELERRAGHREREREESTRAAVEAERARIAADLHDVIAHSVSVMTVQAGAARLLLAESPERARKPLEAIEETGRQALTEMRRLLGILRTEADETGLAPQPGMADLRALLDRVRQAGLPVELAIEGGPEYLPPGIDLAAYRIVQEALTNALEHADRARARVTVRYRQGALELEVADDGPGGRGGGDLRGGLVAMRERVSVYGGNLDAGPRTGGGYAVSAHLPLTGVQP
jgi:signal transduction histidine kinase